MQEELFAGATAAAEGFIYRPQFINEQEEATLLAAVSALPLEDARYREYTARRRVVSWQPEVPAFLLPLRARAAAWAGAPAEDFRQALVNEYRPGTPLGWHRDAPEYGIVVGISLGAACVMRLRPYPPRRGHNPERRSIELAPRSAYIMRDRARWNWQHAVSATKALRYSITFRTLA